MFLAERAPNGLLAGLLAGKVPDWLDIVPESAGKPLELYRVKPRLPLENTGDSPRPRVTE